MSRYLTPSKIGLLILGFLYSEGVVPFADTTKVLSFLLNHILPNAPTTTPGEPVAEPDNVVPISIFETNFSSATATLPGRTVYDLFLKKMWSMDCADALDTFLTNIPIILSKSRDQLLRERNSRENEENPQGRVNGTSPFGAFVRRCHLEYARLQFHDATALWQSFLTYRLASRQAWEKKNTPNGRNTLDSNFSDLHIDSSHPLAQIMYRGMVEENEDESSASVHDVEKLLDFQVSEMQRLGGRLPENMRTKLNQMSSHGVKMPSMAHYLKFLDSWRAGDYTSAYDNLHRYFDYTMQSKDRTFYQYALLNLAILQADFGYHSEAIPAMQEAIATARENKDITCLNFCLSWLYHFGKAFPTEMKEIRDSGILGSETEGLAFLKSRAKDAEMWSLLSTTLLSEAKLELQTGGSIATVFENIAKASYVNVNKNVANATGPALLMRGAIYSRIGLAHSTWSSSETFLQCFADEAPAEDVLKCSCRMASALVQKGRYTQAMELMNDIPKHILRVLKYQQYWTFFAGMLQLRRHLHRRDNRAVDHLLHQLQGQGAPDIEMGFVLFLLRVESLIQREVYNEALDLVEAHAKQALPESTDVLSQIKLMNIKARVMALCNHPLNGFSIAMRAANMANKARILPALWEASANLARILIELQELTAAAEVLEAIVPHVFECEDCELAATTFALLVETNLGLAEDEEPDSTKREEWLSKAMEYTDCAFEQYKHIEDLKGQCDMLVKKATIMHVRGDLKLANDTASQYLSLKKEYEAARV